MPGKGIPEIEYKVFLNAEHVAHVAPSLEGKLMAGHQLDLKCGCGLVVDRTRYAVIIIHQIIH